MRSSHSLKRELIIDLSLLTFCSLILSGGLLVALLRFELPILIKDLAFSYIEELHDGFRKDVRGETDPEMILQAFHAHLDNSVKEHFSPIELAISRGALEGQMIREETRDYLLFLPSLIRFHVSHPFEGDLIFTYSFSIEALHATLDRLKWVVILAAFLFSVILVFAGYHFLFKRNILIPIQHLSETASAFVNENWAKRGEVIRRDELGHIAEALNEMADKIVEKEKKLVLSIESLKKANEEIESSKNEQLQIEKLASVGRLAAGVAHEVGNPLGAISGYVDILRRSYEAQDLANKEDLDLLNRIEQETNRISKIIRALLAQARPPQDRIRPVSLQPVVQRSLELAQIPDSFQVELDFEDPNAEALCEKDQLIQVILNLLINAKHALELIVNERQPSIKIVCAQRQLSSLEMNSPDPVMDSSMVKALKPQSYWMLRITDNGTGIAKEDQKKLFEPFFSTKETGKGTGLGLYVAKSIIESFRGAIVVQSEQGYGTSFSIFLPRDL